MRNFALLNNLVKRIAECRRRMTVIRHEMLLAQESGGDTEHRKRQLHNLSTEVNSLESKIEDARRNRGLF
jgi:hypothetical protein